MALTLKESLSYPPNELAFGTSGLRGLVTDMTDLECYINVVGFLRFLRTTGEEVKTVYLAGDLRPSTPHIMQVVAQAVQDEGLAYENCGLVPTPAVAYYALTKSQPCIMVTGSHIPVDRNGIKFYKSAGEVLKEDETAIKAAVQQVRETLYAETDGRFDANGALAGLAELSKVTAAAEEIYTARYTDFFAPGCLAGAKLVMYQHSAVGRDIIPKILRALGAEVQDAERTEVFVPIDTENVKPSDEALFKDLAARYPDCFAIVSTDGDSDRPFVIDETGTFHRGDILGAVVSEFLGAEAAAFPVSSNDAVSQYLEEHGVQYELTKIGSPYVVTAMEKLSESFKNVSGWEVNGGFLLGSDCLREGRTLAALPTRDALLPIICALLSARQKDCKVSELFAALPKRYTQAGLIDNFPVNVSAKIIATLAPGDEQARALISKVFNAQNGFPGAIESINALDGIRIHFDDGDVAHLRPSGNAPQLRIYSNANTQKRADKIVRLAIAEPNGIFRQLEELIKESA